MGREAAGVCSKLLGISEKKVVFFFKKDTG